MTKFISYDDLKIFNESLNSLNTEEYKIELEKIEPSKAYLNIAQNAKHIIQKNIKTKIDTKIT